MTTGVKIAVGCGVVLLLGVIAVSVAVFGGIYWAKGKAEEFTGEQTRIEEMKKKANANAFTAPADRIVSEDRLVKFLDVRKRVHVVYAKHEATIEAMKNKKDADLADVRTTYNMLNDIRTAQAQAQADAGMSDDEYSFLADQVYKSMYAAEVAKSTGGKTVSEAAGEMYEKAAQEMEKAAALAEAERQKAKAARGGAVATGDEAAAKSVEEGAEDASENLKKTAEDMKKQAGEARENAKELDVPPANLALFKKYEADIKKYAMTGLEWIGL